ncbi:MAG: hypothetical protein OIF50_16890 [Flavobacteriaceae bacterium]|nr:hypothetical protein [Flavobacteriaceae bacterium]
MRLIYIWCLLLLFTGCGSNKDRDPSPSSLIFPEKDSECTTGNSIDNNFSVVTFRWQPASHTDMYRLVLKNLDDQSEQSFSTSETSMAITLKKRTPYQWYIESLSNTTSMTAKSASWRFYNAAEGVSNYAPFPATIIHPQSGASVQIDNLGQVVLEWQTTDVDGDLDNYTVYLDTNNPPSTEIATNIAARSVKAALIPNTIYYWMVKSTDLKGNSSNSGVYQFRVKP